MNTVTVGDFEWAKFGQGYSKRQSAEDDWEFVPLDDAPNEVVIEFGVNARMRSERMRNGVGGGIQVTRSEKNEEIASELGLSADELATKLATPKDNLGTRNRVTEERFDELMGELGLEGQEARDRFSGKYFLPDSQG